MKIHCLPIIILLLICFAPRAKGQETIFMLLKNDRQLANQFYKKSNFPKALNLYIKAARKDPSAGDIILKIARCYYFLKHYDEAVDAWEKYRNDGHTLPLQDVFYCAEAEAGLGHYTKAINNYRAYLSLKPDDLLIINKIWRLNNIRFLYEDSLHYAVRPIHINTGYGELGAVPYRNGIAFMSNRNKIKIVDQVNASLNTSFYSLYYAETLKDTLKKGTAQYWTPSPFNTVLHSNFHVGPIAFYHRSEKMVFTTTREEAGPEGRRTLQLFFAEEQEGEWDITASFPYNSTEYSLCDPTISQDGKTLIFSSDMKGGFGGKDLYKSSFINGAWTKPKNLGSAVNTAYDEIFPFLHHSKTLYFSSNGHAGMGGLDIFKTKVYGNDFGEVENMGYPLNTHFDDFGIYLDSIQNHGYFTSNRKNGGYDDDIYEFDSDLQTYPLEISGLIKYKDHNWAESSELKTLPNAKLQLIDDIRQKIVYESVSDSLGNFVLVVPYFSKYKIRVNSENITEGVVSIDISKHKKLHTQYEIVVVKDVFN